MSFIDISLDENNINKKYKIFYFNKIIIWLF